MKRGWGDHFNKKTDISGSQSRQEFSLRPRTEKYEPIMVINSPKNLRKRINIAISRELKFPPAKHKDFGRELKGGSCDPLENGPKTPGGSFVLGVSTKSNQFFDFFLKKILSLRRKERTGANSLQNYNDSALDYPSNISSFEAVWF